VSKLESGAGTASDVYALARAVVDSPAVQRAQSILKIPAPKSEQQTGALFMAASRLIEDLRELD
jgi:hypothetical protein